MTTTPGPRTEAGKQAVRMRGLFGGETEERAAIWVKRIEAEARADVDGLLTEAREALALRPAGDVGPERIPWFIHSGISHAEGAACSVCDLIRGLALASQRSDGLGRSERAEERQAPDVGRADVDGLVARLDLRALDTALHWMGRDGEPATRKRIAALLAGDKAASWDPTYHEGQTDIQFKIKPTPLSAGDKAEAPTSTREENL